MAGAESAGDNQYGERAERSRGLEHATCGEDYNQKGLRILDGELGLCQLACAPVE